MEAAAAPPTLPSLSLPACRNYDAAAQTSDVINLMSLLPVNATTWTERLFTYEQYTGALSRGLSWWDMYTRRMQRPGTAWAITYDPVPPNPLLSNATGGAAAPLLALNQFFANLIEGTRDEMRVVAPGMVLGQMFARPQSGNNPLPFPVSQRLKFALLQVCDGQGRFPATGNARNIAGTMPIY